MSNLLETASAWLSSVRGANMASTVTYSRPSTGASVSLSATVGRSMATVSTPAGQIRMAAAERDFIVKRSELILSDAVATPRRGDRITDGSGQVWEVTPAMGEPEHRIMPGDVDVRIHTKRVG